MTFNPKYCKNSQGLDPILENKCLSFTLPSNDNNYESIAQIFYGGLVNSHLDDEDAYQLGEKLANVHKLSKDKSLENKELFEGDSIFTSRTINRVIKYINAKVCKKEETKKEINYPNIFKVAIDKFYARTYKSKEYYKDTGKHEQLIFRENIVNTFSKEIDKYSRICSNNSFEDNRKLLEQLRDIQLAVTESKPKEFKNY